jgi:NTE family protein
MHAKHTKTELQQANYTLVLGGGGVTGIAWMTGVLRGLEEKGLNLEQFDKFIGTSAGATVAAQITSGVKIEDLYQRQIDVKKQVNEIAPAINLFKILPKLIPAFLVKNKPIKFRQRVGRMAIKAKTVDAEIRRQVILERMPSHEWPSIDLHIMAVHANSGELINFTKNSNVSFVDAVAASCAVPGIWPSVKISGEYYYDGGIRSGENADFALGSKKVLIISPTGLNGMSMPGSSLKAEIELLARNRSEVVLISPDSQSKNAMGKNPLDPSRREASAKAGYLQGASYPKLGRYSSG